MNAGEHPAGSGDLRPSPLLRMRCDGCGYGVSTRRAPERCPMCAGAAWTLEGWRPFGDLGRDLEPQASTAARRPG